MCQPKIARCRDCGIPLVSGKEHKEGYCRFCLIPNTVSNLSKIQTNKRERLTEEIQNNSTSCSPNNIPPSNDSVNPRILLKKSKRIKLNSVEAFQTAFNKMER